MTDVANAIVLLLNFVIVPGVAYGSQLALGALGVTLIFGILRFANFAHGDVMAFGTMVVLLTTWWFQSLGVGIGPLPTALIALPFGIAAAAAFNLAADRVVFRFYRRRKSPPVILLIASIGVMFALQGHRPLHHRARRSTPPRRGALHHQGLRVQGGDRAEGGPRDQALAGADGGRRGGRRGGALLVPAPHSRRQGDARLLGQRGPRAALRRQPGPGGALRPG